MKLPLFLFFGLLLALWTPTLWHLSALWVAFPQYRYGLLTLLFSVYIAFRNGQALKGPGLHSMLGARAACACPVGKGRVGLLVPGVLIAVAGLLLPIRVIHEANPLWRLTSSALVLLVAVLSLGATYIAGGKRWLKAYAFPVLLIMVAVPWPSQFELPLVQGLAGLNTAASMEILNGMGVAAMRHENVVEIASGMVGVDDACSGVQSLQTTLALALCIGEYFRLKLSERCICVGVGLVVAFVSNVMRMVLLTLVAANAGISAISQWHDLTSVTIGVGCFGCVALLALWFRPQELKRRWAELMDGELPEEKALRLSKETAARQQREAAGVDSRSAASPAAVGASQPGGPGQRGIAEVGTERGTIARTQAEELNAPQPSGLPKLSPQFNYQAVQPLAAGLICWVLMVEVATEVWYRRREASMPPPRPWVIDWPTSHPGFRQEPMSKKVMQAMQCDSATRAFWGGNETGEQWLVNYLRWEPRHISAHLARLHSPESCLPMAGWRLTPLPGIRRMGLLGAPLPFRAYRIDGYGGRPGFVFYCRSGDRQNDEIQEDEGNLAWPSRLKAVWRGRSEQGISVLELVLWGPADEAQAQELIESELRKMIKKSG